MRRLATIVLLTLGFQPVLVARADGPVTIGVMEFVGKKGVSQDKADVLADLLASEISRMGDVTVIGKADIIAVLNLEQQKRLAGCDASECIVEIGGALGVRWVVSGSVGRFGDAYILILKLMDVARVRVISRESRRVKGDEDLLPVELVGATHELFSGVGELMGLTLPDTVTIAARHPQPIERSPAAVTVITREDIETSGATSIPNLMRIVPGMEAVVSSPFFQSLTSRLFWTSAAQYFLVLVDGREANHDFLGFPPWMSQPIFMEDIERIEVIRGPGASLYGANAVAGVISITTRKVPEENSAWVNLSAGEVGGMYVATRAAARSGDWGFSLSGGYDYAGSFEDQRTSARRAWRLRSLVEYRLSDSEQLLLDAGISNARGFLSSTMGMFNADWDLRTLRLAYESEDLHGRLYWLQSPAWTGITADLDFAGVTLARFVPFTVDMHTLDAEIQWSPPRFLEPLLLITGASGRAFWAGCDHCLDADAFADATNPGYHQPGAEMWKFRAGAYVHAEFSPADWVTVTGGLRFDWNDETESFLSPRLAAVFQPAAGQFVRMGVARAFRKPSYTETRAHIEVEFPEESPITGTGQDNFQEFMTRVMGNSHLDNEHLLSFEAGYLGEFADKRLTVSLDLYYTRLTNYIALESKIVPDQLGVSIDMDQSYFRFENSGPDMDILGGELAVRYSPGQHLSLLASWTHREVYNHRMGRFSGTNPKNMITVGGRFRTSIGLLGSLYAFSRSEFTDASVQNPNGLLEPVLTCHLDNVVMIIGRLGWKFRVRDLLEIEAGAKLFLPVSLSGPAYFRYREEGGGVSPAGEPYGGELLSRMVTMFLQGSF